MIVDEPGHWSQSLADEIAGTKWVATPVSGNPDTDTGAILGALERSGVRAHGVLTFFENYVREAARVAAALGLPTPKAQRVRSLDELFAAAGDIGFPAVVKPEFGASAVGCVKVDDPRWAEA